MLEKEILEIRKEHKNYGYRRIWGELQNLNILVNKKKVQRIVQKLNLQVTSFTHKSRKNSFYKGKEGKVYYSYEELKQAIIKYIDYYNNQRIKQELGWGSSV